MFTQWSIRTQLFALAAAAVVPLAAFSLYSIGRQAVERRDAVGAEALALAHRVRARLDDHVVNVDILLTATSEAVAGDLEDGPALDRRLRAIHAGLPGYFANLSILAPNGTMAASATAPPEARSLDFSDRDYFREAKEGRTLAIGEPTRSRTSGQWVVIMAKPILGPRDEVRAIVLTAIALERFQQMFVPEGPPEGSAISILSGKGVVLAGSADPAASVGRDVTGLPVFARALELREGLVEGPGLDGVERLAGVSRASRAPWRAFAGIRKDAALEPVYAALGAQLALALAALSIAAALATLIARRISSPILRVRAAAGRIAAGDLSARASLVPRGEVGTLGADFDAMAAALERADIERRRSKAALDETETALAESRIRMRMAIKAANVGLWDWDLRTNEVFYSSEWKAQIGYDDHEISNDFAEWRSRVHPDDLEAAEQRVGAFIETPWSGYHSVFRLRHRDGSWRWILAQAAIVNGADGRPARMMGSHVDITERKRAEEALHESDARLRLFVEHAPAAIAMFDRDMRYLAHSRRWLADYRLPDRALAGRSHYAVFPELPEHWKEVHRRCLAGSTEGDEEAFARADGSLDWVRWEVRPWTAASGEIGGVMIFSEVITGRKKAENELREAGAKVEALARRLLEVQEAERRAVARELHDEVGGALTAVKLNLQSLRAHPGDAALADGLALVDGAIQAVRALSLDLRPAVLDDMGLVPALRWYCERQAQRSGAAIEPALDAIDLEGEPQLESVCYRIVQEAVTNALRHGEAPLIRVALRRDDGGFSLEIEDGGRGFDVAAAHRRGLAGESSGLLGMQERARLAGGSLSIDSAPGGGTRVKARFTRAEEAPA